MVMACRRSYLALRNLQGGNRVLPTVRFSASLCETQLSASAPNTS